VSAREEGEDEEVEERDREGDGEGRRASRPSSQQLS